MGGRGSSSNLQSTFVRQPAPLQPPQNQVQPISLAQQVPDDTNTPVSVDPYSDFAKMTDDQLAQVFLDSQKASMPNHLDDVSDITQRFVFYNGLNDKPEVLDGAAFTKFMQDNGISQSQVLARSINGGALKTTAGSTRNLSAQDVADMLMYSRLNYVGGKIGGQAYGAGTYFDMNGGSNTGYAAGKTLNAVLNPATAKVITDRALRTKALQYDATHPKFAKATGGYSTSFHNNNMSVYALVMGYNVIKDASGSYHNIIDRKALVFRK